MAQLEAREAVEPLIAALNDRQHPVRYAAIQALGKLGDTRAVESLIEALKDRRAWLVSAAARSLGELGDRRAVAPLLRTLKRKGYAPRSGFKVNVESDVIRALGDLHVFETVVAALEHEEWPVRRQAALTLGRMGDTRAVPALIRALDDPDTHGRHYPVREAAGEALQQLGYPLAERP